MEVASDVVDWVLGVAGALGRLLLRPLGAERFLGVAFRPVAVVVGLVGLGGILAGLLAVLIELNKAGS